MGKNIENVADLTANTRANRLSQVVNQRTALPIKSEIHVHRADTRVKLRKEKK